MVKNVPSNAHETGSVPSQKYSLAKAMTNHSSVLAWKIPWTEKPGGLQSMGSQRGRTERQTLSLHFTSRYIPNTSLSYNRNFIHLTPFIQFSLSPLLISGDHKYNLFFYEFVCVSCISDLQCYVTAWCTT